MPQEIELKLKLPPEAVHAFWQCPALATLPHASPVGQHLYSAYYDTPDQHLRRHGAALRLRRQGEQWIQTLKRGGGAVGGLHSRQEHETPVAAQLVSFTAMIEAGAGDLIEDDAIRRAITVVFVTDFSRTSSVVEPAPGTIIEVSVDRGAVVSGRRRDTLCEVELELKQGEPDALFDLAEALMHALPLRLDNVSKAERGYRLAAGQGIQPVKAAAVALYPEMSVDAAFQTIAGACLQQLQANETGVLERSDPEYVHQARVAIRRLRSAFNVFADAVPKSALSEHLTRLRDIAGALGTARDWDVFAAEVLPPALAGLPADAAQGLRRRTSALRGRARREARALLASSSYSLAVLRFARALAVMSWQAQRAQSCAEAAALPLKSFADTVLTARAKKMRKRGRHADRGNAAHLHALRIQVKKLRYCCEFLSALYSRKPAAAFLKRLETLQAVLGRLNDDAAAQQRLDELAPKLREPGAQEVVSYLRGFFAGDAHATLARFDAAWKRARKAKAFW